MTKQTHHLVSTTSPSWMDRLNDAQKQAVTTTEGPVLVLAGAGTGKTRVITSRVAYVLKSNLAEPHQILAVTFTNKAAHEMKTRVAELINRPVEGWWIGTFHSLSARILRSYAEEVGLTSEFTILGEDDQIHLVKQILQAEKCDEKKWSAKFVLYTLQRWKDQGLTPEQITTHNDVWFGHVSARHVYTQYQERLLTLNACDFGDLLLHCLVLFKSNPTILERLQNQFRYLMVDEYQDTNVAQYLWIRALAHRRDGQHPICCVGDDDQSIYSWRGAEVGNILRFEHDFSGATVIRLEQNYRSTGYILEAASSLIRQNPKRWDKTLWTDQGDGEKVQVFHLWDGREEATHVAEWVETFARRSIDYKNMAVLVRASFQTREFEERFIAVGLPYRVVGGPRFYERAEIKDAIAYLRLIHQPSDDLAFERIINMPKRGIGKTTLQGLHQSAREQRICLIQMAMETLRQDASKIRPSTRQALQGFIQDILRWRDQSRLLKPHELIKMVLDESGYMRHWKESGLPDAPTKIENLKELVRAIEEFPNLESFLEHVGLVMDALQEADTNTVSIMTLHGAKGLEFEVVFLTGWEEGLFPHQKALDQEGQNGLEEERRLAYVGLTRAKKHALISYVTQRKIHHLWQSVWPSRFLSELSPASLEWIQSPHRSVDFESSHFGSHATPSSTTLHGHFKKSFIFEIGQRVFHQKYRWGTVHRPGADATEIYFDEYGLKKVLNSFLKAETDSHEHNTRNQRRFL